jgi:histidinol phosphatase-like PHP family hydrolase/predicted MPP superfamily phosphohydrolase
MKLLVLTDIHDHHEPFDPTPHRRCELGRELVRRAIEDARRQGPLDAIAILGDLVNDGRDAGADAMVAGILAECEQSADGAAVWVVPGNHDYRADGEHLPAGLSGDTRVVEHCGYRVVLFADRYELTMFGRRGEGALAFLEEVAARAGGPIVALQHNPMHRRPPGDYPYMLANRDAVIAGYERAGVTLSLSGHYHGGQDRSEQNGVAYATCPALCEEPYRYTLVTLENRQATLETRQLQPVDLAPVDSHAHTELAYCGDDITLADLLHRSRLMGLGGVVVTEHAPQLYCGPEDFWQAGHVLQPSLWQAPSRADRMHLFRRLTEPLDRSFARVGLEVELDADGEITLRDEDRDVADVLIGAIHWIPERLDGSSEAATIDAFRRATLKLIASGIDILAHPMRRFMRRGTPPPDSLRDELSAALAEHDVAAEVNFHNAPPDEMLFARCLDRGVKIAFATDAHARWEAGALGAHVAFLQRLAGRDDISDLLLYPDGFTDPVGV